MDVNGRPTFDVSNVVKTEVQRRRVVDSLVPAHQRTARGNLFTDSTCEEQLMRKNVVLDARHVPSIAIELLQEYEAHVDWELLPRYNDKGVRLFNEVPLGQDGFRVEGVIVAHVPHCFVTLTRPCARCRRLDGSLHCFRYCVVIGSMGRTGERGRHCGT